ncbi:hypothetical protein PINS_up010939 [Pythium insidiosum]|nr:hypothetical protein PINS_up010939 [Pythium insidiosum]
MQIQIKTLTGRKQTFNFEPDNTILHVKQALQEKEGIQVDQIRLIYSGKQLCVVIAVVLVFFFSERERDSCLSVCHSVPTTRRFRTTTWRPAARSTWCCSFVAAANKGRSITLR